MGTELYYGLQENMIICWGLVVFPFFQVRLKKLSNLERIGRNSDSPATFDTMPLFGSRYPFAWDLEVFSNFHLVLHLIFAGVSFEGKDLVLGSPICRNLKAESGRN